MLLSWTSAAVRTAEEPLLAAGVPLMDRAAFALHVEVLRVLRARRGRVRGAHVAVLAGPGNNGGDALFAAALLARRGVRVTVVTTSARAHAGGLAAVQAGGVRTVTVVEGGTGAALPLEVAVRLAAGADVVLDGLLGIGATGAGVRGEAGWLVEELAGALEVLAAAGEDRPVVVAVDTPSGIGVDEGTCTGPVLPADLTVTFGGAKPGLLLPPADTRAGHVVVVDLGLGLAAVRPAVARLTRQDVAALWPVPVRAAHKYSRGVLGVVAGTSTYPGAAVLTTSAAVLAGVGMVRFVTDVTGPGAVPEPDGASAPTSGHPVDPLGAAVVAQRPEVVLGRGRVQAWVLGPGVDPQDGPRRRTLEQAVEAAVRDGAPVVVDAGALELLPARVGPLVVLTPHAGELARLLGARGEPVSRSDVEAAPVRYARRAHELTGATVLLKGPTTVVVGTGGAVYAQADGPSWLATAGAGDVLAGLLGALLAGMADDLREDPVLVAAAAAAAAAVHGWAADRANPGGPVAALAVAHALPRTVAEVLAGAPGASR
ncbi:bifunctional ADP-dependent NAD(P)H-hydrate dehydratase/NAD(P)H-hydrate epimerase [Cellulomonas soli]|uniref:bifunctional ADP-dependent NAD(P)H-hydrate dehydratase/NAD(P)H-hydrate epimerase n=1 Tax=Cellulomonas soli TaxID=931535 RepID=UPI003F83223D